MQFDSTLFIWIERKQKNRNRINQNTYSGGFITFWFLFFLSRERSNRTKTVDIDVIWLFSRRKLEQNDLYVCISIMGKVLSFDVKTKWKPQKTTTMPIEQKHNTNKYILYSSYWPSASHSNDEREFKNS